MNATCPECGKPVGPNALQGLCLECLMKIGLGTEAPSGASAGAGAHAPGKAFVPPTPAELAPLFPQLEVMGLIGQGGMGAVYKARQKELDRIVALKILPPGTGQGPSFADRFTREAKALAKLNHPGIVTIHDFGRADGLYFFLMEFVDGVNLRQLLQDSRVSAREALAIVPQICDALQYAHDQGIVHRDIKPENILLDRQGRVKVADFGLAKIVRGGDASPRRPGEGEQTAGSAAPASLTAAGKVMGTPQYMAPEQREYPTEVDHRADIYSLGVVFYQMLTGELPGKPIEPPSGKVQVDVRLDEVVLRALEQKPELRYQQASVLKTQIETIATTPQEKLKPLDESPSAPLQRSGRFGKRAFALLLSGLLLGVGLIWLFFPMSVKTSPPHAPLVTSGAGAAPHIESVEVSMDKAVVKQRSFHGEGMLIRFGPRPNRWETSSLYFDNLFDVALKFPWLPRRSAEWIIKTRHTIYWDYYQLDGPLGPMVGKIVLHPGMPTPDADGAYVIGEFQPKGGKPLPISVRLEKAKGGRAIVPSGEESPVKGKAPVAPTNETTLRQIQAAQVELPYAEAELERLTKAYSNNLISAQQLNQAKYKVEELQAESKGDNVEALRIRLRQAEEDLAWLTKLHSNNVVTDQALSEAKYKVEELQAESKGDEAEALRIRLREAEAELTRAKDALDHFAIPQEQYDQAKLKVDLLRAQLTPIPAPSPSTIQEPDHR